MKNTRWTLSAAALCVMALSVYGCSSDSAADDDDDDDGTSSSSGKATSSSGSKGSSSGSKGSSSGSQGSSSGSSGTTSSSGGSGGLSSSGGSSGGLSSSGGSSGGLSSSGGSSGGGVAPACYDGEADTTAYSGLAPQGKGLNKCTAAQITGLLSCVGEDSDEDACDAYLADAANRNCLLCAIPDLVDDATPAERYAGVIYVDAGGAGYTSVCAANVVNEVAECGTKLENQVRCFGATCSTCEEDADGDACVTYSEDNACSAYEPGTDCQAAFTTGQAAITAQCAATTLQSAFTYICGAPPP